MKHIAIANLKKCDMLYEKVYPMNSPCVVVTMAIKYFDLKEICG